MGHGLTLEGVEVQKMAIEMETKLPSLTSNDLHVMADFISLFNLFC